MPDRGRGYGEACARCRAKKRRCRPGTERGVCQMCQRDQAVCAVSRSRAARSGRDITTASSTTAHFASGSNTREVAMEIGCDPAVSRTANTGSNSAGRAVLSTDDFWTPAASSSVESMRHATAARSPRHTGSGVLELLRDPPHQNTNDPEVYLRTYFSWQCPQHMPVDEQLFRRDMQATPRGRYYSDPLLYAIQAQASRHIVNAETGLSFADRANAAIMTSLSQVPTMPTIQALLILSGRDLALGHVSAGWLKSGMAFRMIDDLGIRADMDRPALNETMNEDRNMRVRIFWSAYTWDKFFALTLGRRPTFFLPRDASNQIPRTLSSQTWWTPYLLDQTFFVFAPQRNYDGETFFASCLLYQEIERIIDHLYQSRRIPYSPEDQLFINDQHGRLTEWRNKIDSRVLLDTAYLPTVCPPPHILTVNILYRVAWILLYRPFKNKPILPSTSDTAASICIVRSTEINLLFDLHERTFELRNITYLLAYMAYVTATIDVVEALLTDSLRSVPARKRLELTLRVLTKASQHTPGIQRSIHQLRRELVPHVNNHLMGFSRGTTPTTAHPPADGQDVETRVSPPVEATINTLNDTFSLGLGFEELFASLLPEQTASDPMTWNNEVFNGDLEPTLPSMDLDWLWS